MQRLELCPECTLRFHQLENDIIPEYERYGDKVRRDLHQLKLKVLILRLEQLGEEVPRL